MTDYAALKAEIAKPAYNGMTDAQIGAAVTALNVSGLQRIDPSQAMIQLMRIGDWGWLAGVANGWVTSANASGVGAVAVTGAATPTAPTATLAGTGTVVFPVASGTLSVMVPVATLQGFASGGGVDTHDGDTWREHRQGLRQLAKLAEERRRTKDKEAGDIRQEILAALGEAKPLEGGAEVRDALDAVTAVLPSRAPESVTEAQLRRVTDWAPIYAAMEDLRRAIEFERMLEQDDEEVLLLI